MASVRLSEQLRYTIQLGATEAYNKVNPTPKLKDETLAEIRSAISNNPLQKAMHRFSKEIDPLMQSHNLFESDSMLAQEKNLSEITLKYNEIPLGDGTYKYDGVSQSVDLQAPVAVYLRLAWAMDARVWAEKLIKELTTEDAKKDVEDFQRRVLEAKQKEKEYIYTISKLLNNSNTVKQLLKAWPSAETYIPNHVMQKLHEKAPTRPRSEPQDHNIQDTDLAALNQVALTSKLLGNMQ